MFGKIMWLIVRLIFWISMFLTLGFITFVTGLVFTGGLLGV